MDKWHPIETAPKSTSYDTPHGKLVKAVYLLAFCPDEAVKDRQSCICVVWWEPHQGNGCWWGDGDYEYRPTHWMPLPTAPEGFENAE